MTKKIFTFILALLAIATTAGAQVEINTTNFPDENFRKWLLSQDYGKDGKLTTAEIADVKTMYVDHKDIKDLKGIEFFTALKQLLCTNNQLKSLDVSKNTELTELDCAVNQLAELDLSKNTALGALYCERNQLISLDVSKNTELTDLSCSGNQLTSLDVSLNTELVELYCQRNQLTSLDVSQNTKLTELCCYNNQIKGDKMLALVESLPKVASGNFGVFKLDDEKEKNVITKSQVALAKSKGWKVWACEQTGDEYKWYEYAGSDDTTSLTAVESGQLTVDGWYSIDSKKLSGEPTRKGVYIYKGRKVVK